MEIHIKLYDPCQYACRKVSCSLFSSTNIRHKTFELNFFFQTQTQFIYSILIAFLNYTLEFQFISIQNGPKRVYCFLYTLWNWFILFECIFLFQMCQRHIRKYKFIAFHSHHIAVTITRQIVQNAGACFGCWADGDWHHRTWPWELRWSCGRTNCGSAMWPAYNWSCWPYCDCSPYSSLVPVAAAKKKACFRSMTTVLKSKGET